MPTWIIFALLSALCAALTTIFAKLGMEKIDSTLAAAVRAVIMAIVVVTAATLLGKFKDFGEIPGRAWLSIALSGLAGALSWIFYFYAVKKGPASGAAALDKLSIAFIVVLAALFLGEKLTLKTGGGAILIVAGAILMVFK